MSGPLRSIAGLAVHPIALGGASWSFYDLAGEAGDGGGSERGEGAIATIHAVIDAGVSLIDTARAYTTATHPGHSEALVRRALDSHDARDGVTVATKGGHYRDGDSFPICASREALRSDCEVSRDLLALDRIELYQLHWPDPTVGIAASVEALAELQGEGRIRHIGLCNVDLSQLEEARSVAAIASVQNHFSPLDQSDRPMVEYCTEHSIAYLAYSPLGGSDKHAQLAEAFPAAAAVAARRDVSVQRLALAWLLSISPTLIPICGASRRESVLDSALAATLTLSAEELAELDFEVGSR